MKKLGQTALLSTGLVGFIEFLKLFKLSYVFGSSCAFFSINNVFSPMIGALASSGVGGAFFVLKAILKFAMVGGNIWLLAALQLPFIFAALAWNSRKVMAGVSLASMVLFAANPVGSSAFLYALLWLIPLAISLAPSRNLFFTALGSTFTAHAIGSVAWLYLGNGLTPAAWIALIPLALFERTVFALGMVLTYTVYNKIYALLKDRRKWALPVS